MYHLVGALEILRLAGALGRPLLVTDQGRPRLAAVRGLPHHVTDPGRPPHMRTRDQPLLAVDQGRPLHADSLDHLHRPAGKKHLRPMNQAATVDSLFNAATSAALQLRVKDKKSMKEDRPPPQGGVRPLLVETRLPMARPNQSGQARRAREDNLQSRRTERTRTCVRQPLLHRTSKRLLNSRQYFQYFQ